MPAAVCSEFEPVVFSGSANNLNALDITLQLRGQLISAHRMAMTPKSKPFFHSVGFHLLTDEKL